MALTKVIGDGLGGTNDLTVDTDTLIVDSTNDKVGINVASPNNYYSKELVVGIPDNGGITILNSDTTHAGCIMFADGTGTSAYRGQIVYDHNDDSIGMWTAATNAMRIDSTGAMTKPNQPAFHGTPSAKLENFAIGQYNNVNFATERFDRNADYNAGGSPSAFTAPVTGVYQLNYHLYLQSVDTSATYIQFSINTSNDEYVTIIDPNFSSDIAYYHMTMSVLADMDANDTAYIRMYQQGGDAQLDVATNSSFSGYLVA
tara:strand:- start:64 stop:837 length:774 start_codon:yes stop_codon:yes gene_type:complete